MTGTWQGRRPLKSQRKYRFRQYRRLILRHEPCALQTAKYASYSTGWRRFLGRGARVCHAL